MAILFFLPKQAIRLSPSSSPPAPGHGPLTSSENGKSDAPENNRNQEERQRREVKAHSKEQLVKENRKWKHCGQVFVPLMVEGRTTLSSASIPSMSELLDDQTSDLIIKQL